MSEKLVISPDYAGKRSDMWYFLNFLKVLAVRRYENLSNRVNILID